MTIVTSGPATRAARRRVASKLQGPRVWEKPDQRGLACVLRAQNGRPTWDIAPTDRSHGSGPWPCWRCRRRGATPIDRLLAGGAGGADPGAGRRDPRGAAR